MKYLKYINESVAGLNKLQSYCNDNLSYITDIGCSIVINEINKTLSLNHYRIKINRLKNSYDYNPFRWEDVMYDIIPFIIQLNNEFILMPVYPCATIPILYPNSNLLEIYHGENDNCDTTTYYSLDDLKDTDNEFKELDGVVIYSLQIIVSVKSPKLKYLRK